MGKLITNLSQVIDSVNMLNGGMATFVPSLQSDYTAVIVPEYKIQNNASEFQSLIITNIGTSMLSNGASRQQDKWGLYTAEVKFGSGFNFGFLGIPYTDPKSLKTFTTLIHYYYSTQLSDRGTLRMKSWDWNLPAVYIVNIHTKNVVYAMYDCMFTYPTYQMTPSNNELVIYSTNVSFSSYNEFMYDDYMHIVRENKNDEKTKIERLKND